MTHCLIVVKYEKAPSRGSDVAGVIQRMGDQIRSYTPFGTNIRLNQRNKMRFYARGLKQDVETDRKHSFIKDHSIVLSKQIMVYMLYHTLIFQRC